MLLRVKYNLAAECLPSPAGRGWGWGEAERPVPAFDPNRTLCRCATLVLHGTLVACVRCNSCPMSPEESGMACSAPRPFWFSFSLWADVFEAAGYLGMTIDTLLDDYGHHHSSFQKNAVKATGSVRRPKKQCATIMRGTCRCPVRACATSVVPWRPQACPSCRHSVHAERRRRFCSPNASKVTAKFLTTPLSSIRSIIYKGLQEATYGHPVFALQNGQSWDAAVPLCPRTKSNLRTFVAPLHGEHSESFVAERVT